jgi:hypothetical protein
VVGFGQAVLDPVCSTDRLCRRGAAMKNLAHSASRPAGENNAPSKPGIKHLANQDPAEGRVSLTRRS